MLLPVNTFVAGFYIGLTLTLVPLYMIAHGYDVAAIGLIIAAQGVFQLGLRLVSGILGDRYGEQRVMTAGFAFMLLSAIVFMSSAAFWPMVVAQLFTGAARSSQQPASQSYASRIREGDAASQLGRMLGTTWLGTIAGPVVAGMAAAVVGFEAAFGLAAVVSAIGIAVSVLLPALPRRQPQSLADGLSSVPRLLRSRALALAGLVAFSTAINVSVMFTVFVVHLRGADWGEAAVGILLGAFAVGASASGFGFGRVFKKAGAKGTFALAFGIMGGATLIAAVAESTAAVMAVVVVLGGGTGLGAALWGSLAAANSAPEVRGVAMSVAGLYWAGGMLIGPALFGAIALTWGTANAMTIAGVFLIAVALVTPLAFATLSPPRAPSAPAA